MFKKLFPLFPLFFLLNVLCLPQFVDAHAYPVQFNPTQDEILESPPATIQITFSEPIDVTFSHLLLKSEHGEIIETEQTSKENETLQLQLPSLEAGIYIVEWKIVSLDTHITEGTYQFVIENSSEELIIDDVIEEPQDDSPEPIIDEQPEERLNEQQDKDSNDDVGVPINDKRDTDTFYNLLTLLRSIETMTIMMIAGMYFFNRWIIGNGTPLLLRKPFTKKAEVITYASATFLLLLTGVTHLYIRTLLLTTGSAIDTWSIVGLLASSTLVGALVWIRPLLGLFLMLLIIYRAKAKSAVLVVLLLVVTLSLSGHSLNDHMVISHFVHLTIASMWVGGIFGFVIYSFFLGNSIEKIKFIHSRLLRFSHFALISVGVTVITGFIMSFTYITSRDALVQSFYGQLLSAKIILFIIVIIIAAIHRFFWLPTFTRTASAINRNSSIKKVIWALRIELAVLLAVVIIAGILSTTSPPKSNNQEEPIPIEHHHHHH